MYFHWKSSYQEGRFGITLTGLNPKHVCVCPKQGPGFSVQRIKEGVDRGGEPGSKGGGKWELGVREPGRKGSGTGML